MAKVSLLFLSLILSKTSMALDNGLALTPPMGWMSWERYRCIIDCVNYPDECISEKLFKTTADLLVSEGYAEAGYDYIIIDDCWLASERDANGRLQPDPDRFPSGIKALADYVHSKGLKFGIYEDYGSHTCKGYPGILGHLETDAQTFAEWEIDYIKIDGCNADPEDMDEGYPAFGTYLNATGRPIVYSCSWPFFQEQNGIEPDFERIKQYCNLWRNYNDIQDSWDSLKSIMDYYKYNQDRIAQYAGPGHWNDPDMLIIGNYGLSLDQSRVQMAVWTILAAPLLMSTDLSAVQTEEKAILQNRDIIAINQDPLGIQGKRLGRKNNLEVWIRPITPIVDGQYSYAIAFLSFRDGGTPYPVAVTLQDLELTNPTGYIFQDLYNPSEPFIVGQNDTLHLRIVPLGVVFYRAVVN